MTTPEGDAQITTANERMSLDADDVGWEGDGGEKSSNIVTHMRRKPRCRKPAAVHGTPFTDPTHMLGARKRQKGMKEGMTGADKPRAAGDPCEGSMHPFIVDMQPFSVEGSGIGSSVEELNKLKLTKQVMMNFDCMYLVFCVLQMCHLSMRIMQVLKGYISALLSATEMELVPNGRLKGVRPLTTLW